jgi:NCS1 family nucleobase:cation symporter-1
MALHELYDVNGRYSYTGGFNKNGVYALIIGVAIPVVGLLIPGLRFLWDNAWTFGLFISIIAYTYLMKGDKSILQKGEYEKITSFKTAASGQISDSVDGSSPNVDLY